MVRPTAAVLASLVKAKEYVAFHLWLTRPHFGLLWFRLQAPLHSSVLLLLHVEKSTQYFFMR